MSVVIVIGASCSEKAEPDQDKKISEAHESENNGEERQPDEDQIAEDCVAFVGATKVAPARTVNANCPTCPAGGTEMLSFRQTKTDTVSCSADTCTVVVTIRAAFNPGSGEKITGGLTAWIPPEQRTAYLSGQTPTAEQTFRVQITYKRQGERWRAIEFDRAPAG